MSFHFWKRHIFCRPTARKTQTPGEHAVHRSCATHAGIICFSWDYGVGGVGGRIISENQNEEVNGWGFSDRYEPVRATVLVVFVVVVAVFSILAISGTGREST